VGIDHVIWATADLSTTADRLTREHGLRDGGGGRHVGLGTHNRVFPLGGGYLEVLAVVDPDEAARSPLGRTIAAAPEGLFGWAVAAEDVEAHATRLGLEVTTIERDGLFAHLAGVAEAMAEPPLPFFIERAAGVADPGAGGDAGGIAWLALAGDPERLDEWLGGADLPLRYAEEPDAGPPGLRAVGLGSGAVIR
jgi:Glyoxalase-like domain